MPNRTLTEFIERNPGASRIGLVSPSLLSHLTGNTILPGYRTYPRVLTTFTRTTPYTETLEWVRVFFGEVLGLVLAILRRVA